MFKWITLTFLAFNLGCSFGPKSGESIEFHILDGYTDKWSYRPGEVMKVYVNAMGPATGQIELCDIAGNVVDAVRTKIFPQQVRPDAPWANGYGYTETFDYTIPKLKSGLYYWNRAIPFIVKSNNISNSIVVLCPTNTENAYSNKGGKNLYSPEPRPDRVSFHRPPMANLFSFCDPFLHWIPTATTRKISYISDQDMDYFNELEQADLLVIIGHSEYWTRKGRVNFDKFVEMGKPALILSGNTMWWQVRYSEDGSQMICYKNHPDPISDPLLATINWNQPQLAYSIAGSIGGEFLEGGYGLKNDVGWDGFKIVHPDSLLLQGTGLEAGQVLSLPSSEYDGTYISGYDASGFPIMDISKLGFVHGHIIGFDYGTQGKRTTGTWIAFQKKATSGVVINGASTNWCAASAFSGSDGPRIRKIILNAIEELINHVPLF